MSKIFELRIEHGYDAQWFNKNPELWYLLTEDILEQLDGLVAILDVKNLNNQTSKEMINETENKIHRINSDMQLELNHLIHVMASTRRLDYNDNLVAFISDKVIPCVTNHIMDSSDLVSKDLLSDTLCKFKVLMQSLDNNCYLSASSHVRARVTIDIIDRKISSISYIPQGTNRILLPME